MADAVMVTVSISTKSSINAGANDDVTLLWWNGTQDAWAGIPFKPAEPLATYSTVRLLKHGTEMADIQKVALKVHGESAWLPGEVSIKFTGEHGEQRLFARTFAETDWLSTDATAPGGTGWARELRWIPEPDQVFDDDDSEMSHLQVELLEDRIE